MPRIRKKTSNRQATRDRAKITKKVAEHKKKLKRDTKRNPQWKSKKKADPGVPNSFHLKDQVLAEMAEEKRLAAEAKANRKKGAVEDEEDAPGVSSVASSVIDRAPLTATASLPTAAEAESDDDVPALLDSDLPTLQAALDAADILLEVVDARDIAGGRSATVENLVSEAEGLVFIVVNKCELVPREALEGWLAHLPFPAFLFSARESLGREQLLGALAAAAQAKEGEPLKAALLGLPNVGKSSVLNSLLGKELVKTAPAAPTASSAKSPAPTTTACREVEVSLPGGLTAHLIDTPGWEYVEDDEDEEDPEENIKEMDEDEDDEEDEEDEDKWDALEARVAGDLLRRNLGRVDKVKDVFPLVNYIVSRSNAQDLMLKYNVPYFENGDIEAFLTGVARVNQRVRKHGEPNHDAAARIVLADWALNNFPYYTTAPKGDVAMETDDMGRPDMSAVLEKCKTRKELKAAGLIRFQTGEVDTRDIFLDDDYTEVPADLEDMVDFDEDEEDEEMEGDEDEEDEDEDDEDDEEAVIIGSDEGEEVELEDGTEPSSGSDVEDDDDDDDSESEEEPAPPMRAGKRKAPDSPEVRAKKLKVAKSVSFKAKLEAPKSVAREIKEVKSILKKVDSAPAVAEKPKASRPAKKAKLDKPSKPTKTKSTIVQAPLPRPVVKAPKERKTPEERKALREAKRAAKADKPKPAPPAVAEKKDKKATANGKAPANGKAKKVAAPGEYDFSKHF